jgi:hypothetical protein
MLLTRNLRLAFTATLISLSAVASGRATMLNNTTPAKAIVLTPGQFIVDGALNGTAASPSTLIGEYDPAYHTLIASSASTISPLVNAASESLSVPLRLNGSAYFRVTGAPDTAFTGAQNQLGKYSVEFDLYDSHHNLFQTMPLIFDDVVPGMLDNIWLDPDSDPRRAGGSVTITVTNLVGPGTGHSLDYYVFTGLQPDQPFTATFNNVGFNALIGLFNNANQLTATSQSVNGVPVLVGTADHQGRALIGVTGAGDSQFKGLHDQTGQYGLELIVAPTPEPSSAVLLGLGATLAGFHWRRRRGNGARSSNSA